MELYLSLYGVTVCVSTKDSRFSDVLEELREDFSFFGLSKETKPSDITVILEPFSPLEKQGSFLFKNKAASVYGWGSERIVDYGNDAWIRSAIAPRVFHIFCSKTEDSRELAYLTILSAIGERLDDLGYHRIHALGVSINGHSGLISLPSRGGKSSMASLLLASGQGKIFSDETPLISQGKVYAFPIRMALHREVAQSLNLPVSERVFKRRHYPEKVLYAIPAQSIAESATVSFVMVGGALNTETPAIRRCSKPRVLFFLFQSMVIGIGVAQIGEHLLRFDSVFKLVRTAFSRLSAAIRISFGGETFVFDLSSDARKNTQVLVDFFSESSAR